MLLNVSLYVQHTYGTFQINDSALCRTTASKGAYTIVCSGQITRLSMGIVRCQNKGKLQQGKCLIRCNPTLFTYRLALSTVINELMHFFSVKCSVKGHNMHAVKIIYANLPSLQLNHWQVKSNK